MKRDKFRAVFQGDWFLGGYKNANLQKKGNTFPNGNSGSPRNGFFQIALIWKFFMTK